MKATSAICLLLPLAACAGTFEVAVRPAEGDATAVLQKAFDDCFRAGGGTVTVEKGEYAVGGLRIRSGTTLLLKSGAVLKGGRNCDAYEILADDKVTRFEPANEHVPDKILRLGGVCVKDACRVAVLLAAYGAELRLNGDIARRRHDGISQGNILLIRQKRAVYHKGSIARIFASDGEAEGIAVVKVKGNGHARLLGERFRRARKRLGRNIGESAGSGLQDDGGIHSLRRNNSISEHS